MKNVENDLKDVAFWLSVEDYIMTMSQGTASQGIMSRDIGEARYFLTWRVRPCVVIGRNQIAEAELDLELAKRENVGVTRRSSGGGAVYLDPGAIQYAVIQPYAPGISDDTMRAAREQVAGMIARALNRFGVGAITEGRNDITAGGAKVSGISQLTRGGWLNTHGTLLYDTDLNKLSGLLKPDTDKFQSKAVQSVRSRVSNIKPLIADQDKAVDADQFKNIIETAVREEAKAMGRPLLKFDPDDEQLATINKMRDEVYANPVHTFRASPPYTYRSSRRFPQGKVEIFIGVKGGLVSSCAIRGDFIGVSPVEDIELALLGLPFQLADFDGVISEDDIKDHLGGVGKKEFLDLIFGI